MSVSTIADIMRAEGGHAPYAYTDAHDHRLTLRATLDALGKPYVWAEAENLALGGDLTSVWLTLDQVAALDGHLDAAVPASFTDHTGDTLTVAYSHEYAFFEVTRVADEDADAAAVRVVALTGRLPELRAALKGTAERAQQRADEHAAAKQQAEQQAEPAEVAEQPLPEVGQQWVRRAEPDAGRIVTVSRVWAAGDDGHTAVAYDWGDRGQCGSACPLGVFLGTYEREAAEDDALSPTLRLLRDALLTRPGTTNAEALSGARQFLAAHARELADATQEEVRTHFHTRGSGPDARTWRFGMRFVRNMLRRYADDLDAAAVDGA